MYNGYTVYSDGYIEQWGVGYTSSSASGYNPTTNITVSLSIAYSSTPFIQVCGGNNRDHITVVNNITSNNFRIIWSNSNSSSQDIISVGEPAYWKAIGY